MTNTSQHKRLKTYLFSYNYDDAEWGIEVQAVNKEDARMRVSRMALARYDGELALKVSTHSGMIPRLIVFIMNSSNAVRRLLFTR